MKNEKRLEVELNPREVLQALKEYLENNEHFNFDDIEVAESIRLTMSSFYVDDLSLSEVNVANISFLEES